MKPPWISTVPCGVSKNVCSADHRFANPRSCTGTVTYVSVVPGTHDARDFVDLVHFREKLALQVEDGIIAQLRTGEVATAESRQARTP